MIHDNKRAWITPPNSEREPEYLPARMINEFVYCPRLFYLEHVEGLFAHNADTIDGSIKHQRVDSGTGELPKAPSKSARGKTQKAENDSEQQPDEAQEMETLHARSVTLASDRYGVIAKLDLVEATGQIATPVDYKRGRPRTDESGLPGAWDPERVQLCVQALVLRDNGYDCHSGFIYYAETRQRVEVRIDEPLIEMTLSTIEQARQLICDRLIPPPLEDSPKCPRCSLVSICLPDETNACRWKADHRVRQRELFDNGPRLYQLGLADQQTAVPIRRLVPARDERRPLYVNTPGMTVGKSSQVLTIKEQGTVVQEVRLREVSQVNLIGPVQITTQAMFELLQADVPVCYFSMGNWFYGMSVGHGQKNILMRREQFRAADDPYFCLKLSRALVAGKIRNSRVMLMRNHRQVPRETVGFLKSLEIQAITCDSVSSLLGIEGTAAAAYFAEFAGMLKVGRRDDPDAQYADDDCGDGDGPAWDETNLHFDFRSRNRRPPRDPVNALLSLAYSMLAKDLTIVCTSIGLDPHLGFYHQPRPGRPALALDLMEPFRPLIAESAVLSAINSRMISPEDFVQAGDSVALNPSGRKKFFQAYESRMDSLVTHPMFDYRLSYRRLLEVQTRLLTRMLTDELPEYYVFTTR